ncbi:hypothetical protein V6N13_147476 [Hibiscus sabdariffa]
MHWKGLWLAFGRHGEVLDAFIANKRNKEGRKFGFVRTSNETDANRMIERLNNFQLFGSKITVSLQRFQTRQSYWRRVHSGSEYDMHMKGNIGNKEVKGRTSNPETEKKEKDDEKITQDKVEIHVKKQKRRMRIYGHVESESLWKLKNYLIGETSTVCSIESVRTRLLERGMGNDSKAGVSFSRLKTWIYTECSKTYNGLI